MKQYLPCTDDRVDMRDNMVIAYTALNSRDMLKQKNTNDIFKNYLLCN